ncbi:biopolymer transporter ExbD [candidate division KSB1 bacterium]|nr:biopolymer transporter ExbD [candidate division KSB1 bacterium]
MAFIPSRIKKHDTSPKRVSLNLTSMMDMFTIILVFLLKTYSTEGQLIHPSENLTLPISSVKNPAEIALDVVVSKEWIMVNNEPVVLISEVEEQPGLIIEPLSRMLQRYATEARRMEEMYGVKFSGKVTIQGDKALAFRMLIKVMATCGRSEYPNMRLVVYQKEA